MIIERIGPLSLAKVMGAIYAIIGLVAGALFTLLALMGALAGASQDPEAAWLAPLFDKAAGGIAWQAACHRAGCRKCHPGTDSDGGTTRATYDTQR